LFVLAFQPLIFYRNHLIRLTSYIPFDIQGFHLPLATFMENAARHGVWPFWDPFTYSGVPIHADIQAQLFYPPTWLAIGLDVATGGDRLFYWLELSTALHMTIAGLATYFFLRKFGSSALVAFFGATVFQIGPFFASQAQHFGSICAAAWFPLILLSLFHLAEGFRARWLGVLACSIAMGLLSGFPAAMLVELGMASLFCFALIASRAAKFRLILQFIAGCVLAVGIAAIQLIPTMRLSALSIGSLRHEWLGAARGMPWESLVSFVWPNYYHIFEAWDPTRYTLGYEFTFLYTFCGYIAVFLIALSPIFLRKSRVLAASAALWVVSAIWMLGHQTPAYALVVGFLPQTIQGAAYPETALLGFSMFAAATTSMVLERLRPKLPLAVLVLLVSLNSWNLLRISANKVFNSFPGSYKEATAGWTEAGVKMPNALRDLTATNTPPLRIDLLLKEDFTFREAADTLGIHSASGDNPFLLLNYFDLRRQFLKDDDSGRRLYFRDLDTPWIRALNIGYVIDNKMAPERPLGDSYELLPFNTVRIYKVKDPLPRYYVQSKIWRASSHDEARRRIQDPAFNPLGETVVENLPSGWTPDPDATGSVRVIRYDNNRVELEVRSTGRAILGSSEILYPGWTAAINGQPAELLPVNLAFRGIPVEQGENHIVMEYFPRGLISSLLVTVAALSITGLLLFVPRPVTEASPRKDAERV
jgi:hypothetical protein